MKFPLPIFVLVLTCSCSFSPPREEGSIFFDPIEWEYLLKKYVSDSGKVDYEGFISEKEKLDAYLIKIKNNPPDEEKWTKEEKLAYWINAYNAFTIALVLDYYPLKSIKDIGSTIQIPLVNTPWDIKFIEIGGKKLSLNNLEHDILRKEFKEPRIHFAINCASESCPKLRNEAYSAEKLEQQLWDQAVEFINDPSRNKISKNRIRISKIFNWFTGDFIRNGSLIDFLNKYSKEQIAADATIDYLEYDWELND